MNYNIFANARADNTTIEQDTDSTNYIIDDGSEYTSGYNAGYNTEYSSSTNNLPYQSDISSTVYSNTNMSYGKIPDSMLTDKFEETIVPSEDMLDEKYGGYARGVLLDKTPDKPMLASDEPRRNGNMSRNILNLHHTGSRSGSDGPHHPELFTGFLGKEHHDPRGTQNSPNLDAVRKQHESRMRFVKFGADADNSVTSGSRSDQELMRDKQKAFKWTKDRLKIFSTEKDSIARSGSRKYDPKSAVKKASLESRTVSGLAADGTQSNNNVILGKARIVKTKWYHEDTSEQDFSVARFGGENRNKTILGIENRVKSGVSTQMLSDADVSKIMRVSASLMKDAVMMKKLNTDTDMDHSESSNTAHYKQRSEINDVISLASQLVMDAKFATSDKTQLSKSLTPVQDQSAVNKVMMNHLIPANHYLNTAAIYKSVKQGKDLSSIKNKVLTDDKAAPVVSDKVIESKQRITDINLAKRNTQIDAEGENIEVKKYKSTSERAVVNRVGEFNPGHVYTESDETQRKKHAKIQSKQKSASDTVNDANFYDNKCKERKIGVLGSKYSFRSIKREKSMASMDEF